MEKFLITGLGNPGSLYRNTRHNLGFLIINRIAEKYLLSFSRKKFGYVSEFTYKKKILLLKPSTYVNDSGLSVKYWMNKEKIPLKNILIISDDIYLNFGNIRLRGKGGDGGHNGLKSIEKELRTSHYARIRFGIKNDRWMKEKIDYVLGIWSEEELKNIFDKLEISIHIIFSFILNGLQKTMNLFNNKNI
ncbi:MAG: aminoacyl-tRNA hydrolase [Flavobacteriales bacterium]|jgi:PTH1 family peptidyl-tRNA hydrolase|uniref:aminoacyl-tRNA hydrolase n=1 Tax=Blattabacterium sp. (Mastotermes darwiniensis) TaxID=39768 RepID=UPI000231DF1B|nr:aminoacyl-tRNA hydrolase [Blattabacterium sp. (Mastotermes darwiniensis)]AER40847.1 peptidyl-tRNA hydrolase [Blattabacterium sp. (Mastotermes darwiniensis) str. MADAR]MDR1804694.1 aminoacyl-tRNA hydrolase [Flavobacteriales bacterium]